MFTKIADRIDAMNDLIGRGVSWLTLFMALVMFVIVVLRYIFNMGWIWMQESVVFMHGFVFMLAGGYTLLAEEHVRIDIFYRPMSERKKAIVNLVGIVFLLFPTCFVIFYYGYPYVSDSWSVLEGSREAGGLPGVFLLKTSILVFPVLVGLQGVAKFIRALNTLTTSK
ncbi:MAG: C4-dicarboxylate ABC transporter permease [Desulfobulbaceae bacterium S3730MH12]|nr:MAG: C4-dicarboxylate ABC transporter permease [Desulfobulbaceae bacterium S5133MH15]OEU58123.1 MAG: C4-dicarboxylate ABC transporter permease [Desulfobulbaceae bacterium S3730MH12]OEU82410.1 MAG: C4-dicarboxylate ABC transporter permease [Desulfobulbaceae bacterium C00003063]